MYSNFSVNLTEIVAQMLFLVFRKAARVCGAFAIPLRTMNLDCDADAVTIGLRGSYRSEDHDTGGCIIISEACTAHLVLLAGA